MRIAPQRPISTHFTPQPSSQDVLKIGEIIHNVFAIIAREIARIKTRRRDGATGWQVPGWVPGVDVSEQSGRMSHSQSRFFFIASSLRRVFPENRIPNNRDL
jgi:hypothetical protein